MLVTVPLASFLIHRNWEKIKSRLGRSSDDFERADGSESKNRPMKCNGKSKAISPLNSHTTAHAVNHNEYVFRHGTSHVHSFPAPATRYHPSNKATKLVSPIDSLMSLLEADQPTKNSSFLENQQLPKSFERKKSLGETALPFCMLSDGKITSTPRNVRRKRAQNIVPSITKSHKVLQKWRSLPTLYANDLGQKAGKGQLSRDKSSTMREIFFEANKNFTAPNSPSAHSVFPADKHKTAAHFSSPSPAMSQRSKVQRQPVQHPDQPSSSKSKDSSSWVERRKLSNYNSFPRRRRKRDVAVSVKATGRRQSHNYLKVPFSFEDHKARRLSGTAQLENLCTNLELLAKRLVSANHADTELKPGMNCGNKAIPDITVTLDDPAR